MQLSKLELYWTHLQYRKPKIYFCKALLPRKGMTYDSLIVFFLVGIGGFQPISRDTDDNGEMYKCWWTNKRG